MLFVVRDLVYTAHALAGGVWIGGSLVYLVVITPALRLGGAKPEVSAQVARLFRTLVNVCIGVLVVTGVFLVFDRLSTITVGTAYVVALTLKILVALTLFGLALYQAQEARRLARNRGLFWRLAPRLILALGVVAFLLGATLMLLYEAQLTSFVGG
jgi:uncharacterized membrane protein